MHTKHILFHTLTAGLLALSVHGQSVWTGAEDTNYLNANNWQPAGIPDATIPVNIPDGVSVAAGDDTLFERGADTVLVGGTLRLDNMRFLNARGGAARFSMEEGLLDHAGTYFIAGQNREGVFRQTGGRVVTRVSRGFFVSDGAGGSSKLDLLGGEFEVEMDGIYDNDLHNAWIGRGGSLDRIFVNGGQFTLTNTAGGATQRWWRMTRNASMVIESGRVDLVNLQAVTVGHSRSGVSATEQASIVVRGGEFSAEVRVAFVVGWGTNGAMGIHGGELSILKVGTDGGDLWIDGQESTTWATVEQTGGTVLVEGQIIIARHATGNVASYRLAGGVLRTGDLTRGDGTHGRFFFDGGTLVLEGDRRGLQNEPWFVAGGAVTASFDANAGETTFSVVPVQGLPREHHFRFDDGFADAGAAANDGIASGGALTEDNALGVIAGGGGLRLDGAVNSRVSLTRAVSFSATEPWTVSWWGRRSHLGGSKGMVLGEAGSSGNFIWLNDSQRGLRFRPENAVNLDFYAPRDSAMRHFALVADGAGRLSLYMDGVFSETLGGLTAWTFNTIGEGFPTGSSNFNFEGWLDEVRVSSGALSAEEIAAIYVSEALERVVPEPERVRVFLLGGQSNAEGYGEANLLKPEWFYPQDNVDFLYRFPNGPFVSATLRPGVARSGSFGPEISMGAWLADFYRGREPGTRVAIIKYARGGTNLHTQWSPAGGTEYLIFQETVAAGLGELREMYPDAELRIDGMAWMQGESDCSDAHAPNYQGNLVNFIADVRARWGEDLPFAIGRLSVNQTNRQAGPLATVRAAQTAVAAADPRTGLVDTDGFGLLGDNLHFNHEGKLDMGVAFARQLAYLSWANAAFAPGEIDAGLSMPDVDVNGSGLVNELEWRFGFNPLGNQEGIRVQLLAGAEGVELMINRVVPEGAFVVMEAASLTGPWIPSSLQPLVVSFQDNFFLQLPASQQPTMFYHVQYQP